MIFDGIYEKLEKMEKTISFELQRLNQAYLNLDAKIERLRPRCEKKIAGISKEENDLQKIYCKKRCTAKPLRK